MPPGRALARRRSLIRQAILRFKLAGADDHEIGVIHRESGVGERVVYIKLSRVVNVGRWALELDDGRSIPYHRVIEIRDGRGFVVWRR
jgi:uncharacterized protein (UPF0248 family)